MKGKTILLADNSDVFRTMCSNILTEAGFHTIIARDGNEAIQQLSSSASDIDLMILDLEISQIDGFKVLKWVKDNNHQRTLPVLVITESYEFGNLLAELKHLGATGLTARSTSSEHLVYRVNDLLFDKKSSDRIARRVPTTIPANLSAGDTTATGFILNISETGLFINYTNENLKTGDILHLTFSLPSEDDAIEAEGKVVWLNKSEGNTENLFKGFGIHFTKIIPEDREKIAIFVKREIEMLS